MASVFIFLTKLVLIFVILRKVDATLNCEVNETTEIILTPKQNQSSNVNCQSEISTQDVTWYMKNFQVPLEDNQWKAFNCTDDNSHVNEIFCVHGPLDPPTISGEDNLVAGRTTNLTCTIYNVYPAPNIEWFLGPDNITLNASLDTTLEISSSLFNATSSLSFTPQWQHHEQNLTCIIFPSVANVWTPENASIQLRVPSDSGQSDKIRVGNATSSSLFISWDLKHDNITLAYCPNSTMDSDNVRTSEDLTCPDYKEITDINETSYNLTGLEPFQWYDVTLLVGGNAVAREIASTAPPLPEYYGVFMTLTPQKEKLKITRLPTMNRTVPSDLCFVVIQTRDKIRHNCPNGCCKPGSTFSIEDITGYGLVSSGRGFYSLPSPPMILNSTFGILDMPHVSIVSGAVLGAAVLILLCSVAILLFLNFICKGFEESMNIDIREGRNVSHEANDHMTYEMIQNGDRAYTSLKLSPSHSSIIAPENVTFFTRLGVIGRGDFGGVWKGELRSNQSQVNVAIRQIPVQVTESPNVLQAVKVLSELPDQPNVVKCLGYCQEQGSILYEFISRGTLLIHLQTTGVQPQPTYGNLKPKRVGIDEGSLLNLAWQTAKGMQFLASKRIIHGTLCAHNVLLSDKKQCKLSDYGLSSSLFSNRGKPTRWSSPETMVTGDQSTYGDIWSFGIVLWEIVTLGARPYPNMTFDTVQTEVADGYRMPRPRQCGEEVYTVISGCWEKEATNRSNFDQILESLERILEKTHNYLSLNDLDEGLYASTLDM